MVLVLLYWNPSPGSNTAGWENAMSSSWRGVNTRWGSVNNCWAKAGFAE